MSSNISVFKTILATSQSFEK